MGQELMWKKREIQMFQQCINYEGTEILRERGGSGMLRDPKTELSPSKLHSSLVPSASFYLSVPLSLRPSVCPLTVCSLWRPEPKRFFFHSLQ